jgi:FMN reductase
MSLIVTIAGSPSPASRTVALGRHVSSLLEARGFEVRTISVRDLDPTAVLHARVDAPDVSEALGLVERADGVVIATPIYKAAYAGVLKAFLDLLPQFGLTGKSVLPLATGGTLAHVLALDYGLRPVLSSLGPLHIVTSLFVLDKLVEVTDAGVVLEPAIAERLDVVLDELAQSVRRNRA